MDSIRHTDMRITAVTALLCCMCQARASLSARFLLAIFSQPGCRQPSRGSHSDSCSMSISALKPR